MTETPTSWQPKRVDQICDLGRGRVISQEEILRHSGVYPVFSSQSKDDGVFGYLDTYDFEGDYVTWTTDGAHAGTVFFRSGRFNCTNVCGTLKPKSPETSASFLARALSPVSKRHVSYVGNPKLMNNVMAAIELRLPSRPEQDFIGLVLDTVDEAIANTESVIAKLRQVRAGLLHDLLTRGLDAHGQLRDPIAHPEQFQASPLGRIPKEWEVKLLGAICRPQQWSTISTSELSSTGFPVFGANGQIGHYHNFNHEHPCVAITCRGATCGTIHVTPPRCYITGNAMALDDLNDEQVRLRFLAEFLRKRGMADCITGSAQPQIIRASLLNISIPRPPLREQDLVTSILTSHDIQANAEDSFLAKLRSLKSGLMTDLLTGRVRVPAEKGN